MANNFSYMNLPLQINQTFAGPLEKKVIFDSRAEADEWLIGPYAYEGAVVRIKDSGKWKIYVVQNNDGVLELEEHSSGSSSIDGLLDEVDLLSTDLKKVSADEIIDKVNEVIITLSTKVKVDIDPLGTEESKDEGEEVLRSGKKSSSLNVDNVTLGDAVYKLNELISKLSTNKPDPNPEENEEER